MARKPSRSLLKQQDGATAIEFALISPILILFVIGIIEVSMMLLAQNILESATFIAARTSKTGYTADGITREDTIMQALNERASAFLDVSKIKINSLSYNEFGDIGQPEPFVDANANGVRDSGENYTDVNHNSKYDSDMGSGGAGGAGQLVVYTVTYPWHVFTPIMSQFVGANGIINLTARTVVRNEPF